jgi:hypothetical protein
VTTGIKNYRGTNADSNALMVLDESRNTGLVPSVQVDNEAVTEIRPHIKRLVVRDFCPRRLFKLK